ncbi:hypothetical protein QYF36_026287 [Acer negundo]|nr:hypothetical protein QYF36_026287 [Acer negundo]
MIIENEAAHNMGDAVETSLFNGNQEQVVVYANNRPGSGTEGKVNDKMGYGITLDGGTKESQNVSYTETGFNVNNEKSNERWDSEHSGQVMASGKETSLVKKKKKKRKRWAREWGRRSSESGEATVMETKRPYGIDVGTSNPIFKKLRTEDAFDRDVVEMARNSTEKSSILR